MKILIADDHRLVVEAVADKLTQLGPGISFVFALSVPQLWEQLSTEPDLALIDLGMPGADGLNHVAEVHRRLPDLPIIVLSGQEDPMTMRQALDCGAMGYVPKAYSPDVMLSAVRLVMAGGVYIPPMMLRTAGHAMLPAAGGGVLPSHAVGHGVSAPDTAQPSDHARLALTERQVEVLHLLSEGKPNKLIARGLGISEGTVKIHLAAIFRALGVRNRTEAVVAARAVRDA